MSETINEAVEAEAADTAAVVADVIAESVAEETARETAIETVAPVVEAVEDLAEEVAEIVEDFKEETEWEKTRTLLTELSQIQTAQIMGGISALLNPSPLLETETAPETEPETEPGTVEIPAGDVEEIVLDPGASGAPETSESTGAKRRRLVGRNR